MIIHPKQESKKYSFNLQVKNVQIEQVDSFNYLGLTIQDNLRWDKHISKISIKMSRMSGVLSRLGNNVDKKFLTSIYYSHIQSHISYMSPIWGHSATDSQISALQVAQNNALRSIYRNQYYACGLSTTQIRKSHGIFSVRQLIKYNTAILAFKVEKKLIKSNITINHFADRHNYNTRNSRNIYQGSFRSNVGKFDTSRMMAVEFNSLPSDIKTIPSLHIYKKRVKQHILSNQ